MHKTDASMRGRPRGSADGARGQSMTEYIIIVALIAIACIGVIGLFGNDIRALFGASSDALAGEKRDDSGALRSTYHYENHNLQSFGDATAGAIERR